MSNEFHTIRGECTSIIPSGPGYESTSWTNRACASVGFVPGQTTVDGSHFIDLSYGYSRNHLWRVCLFCRPFNAHFELVSQNLGILIAFFIGFTLLLLFFTEKNTGVRADVTRVLYNRRSLEESKRQDGQGEPSSSSPIDKHTPTIKSSNRGIAPPVSEILTFEDINYTVRLKDGEPKHLLSHVSGYVAPGKLTALMGESGAGKVLLHNALLSLHLIFHAQTTLLNVLADRVETGVVDGNRRINGGKLPADFQAQTCVESFQPACHS